MKITGTFLDEISHDIPHQNWGRAEWDRDFAAMKSIGIDTVILIRSGHKRFLTFPSEYLIREEGCYRPPVDLVALFLELAEKYGSSKAFGGWYLNLEVSRASRTIIELYRDLGNYVKSISGNLPTMISPYIDGIKAVSAFDAKLTREKAVALEEHERDWDTILGGISGAVNIVAFQDGHCDFHELADYLRINRTLAERHNMTCWTNCESFDRDMPIKFPPIKWEKMLLKLEAARKAGVEKAITFEFSHFMSPNSCYPAAANLFNRYCEHFGIRC